jgi:hypothetical protein
MEQVFFLLSSILAGEKIIRGTVGVFFHRIAKLMRTTSGDDIGRESGLYLKDFFARYKLNRRSTMRGGFKFA